MAALELEGQFGVVDPQEVQDCRLEVVDVITGDVRHAKVEKVGIDRITVAGKPMPVTRYRVTAGGNRWDVCYDAGNRLAKRVWTRDGRTVVAELTRLAGD